MALRRMTAADYAELGVPVPPHMVLHCIRGYEINGRWEDEAYAAGAQRRGPPVETRCDECGDETGECACE